MTSIFPPFNRRTSFRKEPYFYEAGRGAYYKSTGGPFPTLNLNFLTGTLDPRITFSRGTNATLVNSTGKITYAPANLLTYSEQFDNAGWTKTRTTISANATAAPDGTLTADKLVETATTGQHLCGQSAGSQSAGSFVFSVYIKAGERFRGECTVGSSVGGVNGFYASFNLNTGTATLLGQFGTGFTGVSASLTSAGSEWYRFALVGTTSSTSTIAGQINLYDNNGALSYTGDGTSGFYLWGAQIEPVTYQTTPSTYNVTTSAAYYGPRFDYDPLTLQCKGLLIEEQRTNFLTNSEQFNNWTTENATVTQNAASSPAGTTTADKIIANTTSGGHGVYLSYAVTLSTTYTFSAYFKASEQTFAALSGYDNATFYATFNLSTGEVVATSGLVSASISAVGNNWYRCVITRTAAATGTAYFYVRGMASGVFTSYTGNGTDGVFVWGAQLEAGAFATSYIPTTSAAVTRSADVASMTGSNFSSWYNASAGTFWVLFDGPASGTKAIIAADNNTSSNNIQLYTSSTDPKFLVADGGVTQADIDAGTVAATTQYKFAGAYEANNFAASIAGGAAVTDTSGTVPTVDRLRIGTNQSGNYLSGHVATIKYYNTRISDAKLQVLTS